MIVLLSSFINLLRANDNVDTSTGEIIQDDTIRVIIPIDIIRKANIKLNERIKLKKIVMTQDEQIKQYRSLLDLKDTKIDNLETRIYHLNSLNKNLVDTNDKLKDSNSKYKVIAIGGVVVSVGLILGIFIF